MLLNNKQDFPLSVDINIKGNKFSLKKMAVSLIGNNFKIVSYKYESIFWKAEIRNLDEIMF